MENHDNVHGTIRKSAMFQQPGMSSYSVKFDEAVQPETSGRRFGAAIPLDLLPEDPEPDGKRVVCSFQHEGKNTTAVVTHMEPE